MTMKSPRRPFSSAGLRSAFAAAAAIATASLATGCDRAADGDSPAPLTVQFRLSTGGAAPVFVYEGCFLEFTMVQAGSGRDVTPTFACACACDSSTCQGPVACGACAAQPREIAAATPFDYTWTANTIQSESRGSWSCVRTTNLAPGAYRIEVPVYETAEAAEAHTGARTVSADFTLPATAPVILDVTAP